MQRLYLNDVTKHNVLHFAHHLSHLHTNGRENDGTNVVDAYVVMDVNRYCKRERSIVQFNDLVPYLRINPIRRRDT